MRIPFSCPIRFFSHLVFLLETLVNQRLLGNETALPLKRGEPGVKVPLFKGDLGGSKRFFTEKRTFQTSSKYFLYFYNYYKVVRKFVALA
ncbi:hypothetical protein FD724_12050 [Nostoc sp. C057]|nr:hypothetical protein FD724_12050 [Nostoc sp. C057]